MHINLSEPQASKALSVKDIRALELEIAKRSTPLDELMRRAGYALAEYIDQACPATAPVAILCGSGNNGGDGWVAARILARLGRSVNLVTSRAAEGVKAEPAASEAHATMNAIEQESLPINILIAPEIDQVKAILATCPIVIDALLGTGFNGASVKEPYGTWIQLANEAHMNANTLNRFHIACDIPSGIAADTGAAADKAFEADATVTMIVPKLSMNASNQNTYFGTIVVADIEHATEL